MKCVIAIALLSFAIPLYAAAEKKPIKVCYENVELKPFILGTKTIPAKPGYIVELVKLAVEASGAKAVFYRKPWKRCIHNLKHGEVDAIFAAIRTPEREKWASFPDSAHAEQYLLKVTYPIFVNRKSNLKWDGQQFHGVKYGVGAPLGYIARQHLMEMNVYPKGVHHLNLERGMRMVALGRLDGYVINQTTGEQLVQNLGLDEQVTTLSTPFMYEFLHLAFSKPFFQKSKLCAEQVWHQLALTRQTYGEKLLNSYKNGSEFTLTLPKSSYQKGC
ncbi:transporter substrate-binding domain-containing protein [Vibrio sp. S4M6]|uniref:substrate-binding periplasmic protein n=1 Tax=Vibrio sinus TaxID=2946865 RepID=UPI00202A1C65|nr:transporter substrate-binding domain-containing protein [Vibrio sinus]MCL9782401.1 transporter substrate-binding domain-containing protein [Vibrio sinus]